VCRCADGRPQWEYTTKDEVISPTVSLEAMMLSCAVDTNEVRYIIVTDIPGPFLHTDMENNVHMLLEGTIAELIIKLDPSIYRKHIWYNQIGKPMLYAQLENTIRDITNSSIVWKLLYSTPQEWGLKINQYNHCGVNKIINATKGPIIWHVDNLKISHAEKDIVDDILK